MHFEHANVMLSERVSNTLTTLSRSLQTANSGALRSCQLKMRFADFRSDLLELLAVMGAALADAGLSLLSQLLIKFRGGPPRSDALDRLLEQSFGFLAQRGVRVGVHFKTSTRETWQYGAEFWSAMDLPSDDTACFICRRG
jgi:hypothetical protein